MKVRIFDKHLVKENYAVWAVISTIATIVFIPDFDSKVKLIMFIVTIAAMVGIYIYKWRKANMLTSIEFQINGSTVEISEGDVFCSNGLKAIAFNEYFDTQVDDRVIMKTSLNGQYLTNICSDISKLDNEIESDERINKKGRVLSVERKVGKSKKYRLGTVFKDGEYLLIAFSHFDDDNRAYLEMDDYLSCLMNFWNELDILYAGSDVTVPLLGAGITRFRGYENITAQELIDMLITTFKMSRIRFQYPARLHIVLKNEMIKQINLYDIKNKY